MKMNKINNNQKQKNLTHHKLHPINLNLRRKFQTIRIQIMTVWKVDRYKVQKKIKKKMKLTKFKIQRWKIQK